MTYDEAVKVADVVQWADGGCVDCAAKLAQHLVEKFPEVDWVAAFRESLAANKRNWTPKTLGLES